MPPLSRHTTFAGMWDPSLARREIVSIFVPPSQRRGTAGGPLRSTGAGDVASGRDGSAALPLERMRSGSGSDGTAPSYAVPCRPTVGARGAAAAG